MRTDLVIFEAWYSEQRWFLFAYKTHCFVYVRFYRDQCPLLIALDYAVRVLLGLVYLLKAQDYLHNLAQGFCGISSASGLFNMIFFLLLDLLTFDIYSLYGMWTIRYSNIFLQDPSVNVKKVSAYQVNEQLLSCFCKTSLRL